MKWSSALKAVRNFFTKTVPNFFTKKAGLNSFLLLSVVIVSIPLILYSETFSDLSNKQDWWGQFGDFLNVFVNIAIGVILGYISYVTYNTTFNYNKLHTTPIISFAVEPKKTIGGGDFPESWVILNLTSAGAKDIHLRFFIDDKITRWIQCFSMLGNSKVPIPWIRYARRIEVFYSDTFGKRYFQLGYEHLTGNPEEIKREEWQEFIDKGRGKWANSAAVLLVYDDMIIKSMGRPEMQKFKDHMQKFFV